MKLPPLVRQYDILSNQWGQFTRQSPRFSFFTTKTARSAMAERAAFFDFVIAPEQLSKKLPARK